MKINYKYVFTFLVSLAVIIACTKEVGLYTEVEFEISETHIADGFINTPLATSITVTPEELVEGYGYSYSYKINTGEGYFQDESGATIAEGDKLGLNPLSASLNYIATKIGDHSITFTAEDTFGFQEQVTASYAISDVPVSWTATGPTGQVLLGTSQDITVTLGSETTGAGVTYERNYSFTQGTGTITSSPSGASEALNEFISITPGTYALEYVSTELGQTTLEFLLKDSNGQEIVQTISFEVVDELSSEKEITSFIVNGVVGTINGTTIDVVLPEGTDVTALTPEIIHTGASITPESETSQDFSNPVIYTVTAQNQTIQEYTVALTVEGNEAKDITDFAIDGVDGIITGTNISVTLPAGTDVTALSSTVTHTGASVNPTSGVAQDFTSPVEYTVTAADGTTKVYTVTVSLAPALSSDNNITSFSIDGEVVNNPAIAFTITLPAGTDVTVLSPTIMHEGNSINPVSGVVQDFTSPVEYTVTAADGSTKVYTVTVIVPALSNDKDITSFTIDGVVVNNPATAFTITLPAGTDVTTLSPTIVHEGNSINPVSGVVQDFTSPVEYTVTAADGSTQVYTVTVIAPVLSNDKDITSFTIDGVMVNNPATAFTITLPAGTDVTTLSPAIVHEGNSINPASGVAQDFISPIEYTVTAADGSTKVYTVTVSLAPALSSDKDITSFTIDGVVVNNPATAFTITLPAGTDVTTLSPAIMHEGNSINPVSGVAQDFTSPIEYTVTAADGSTKVYTVTVLAPALSDTNDITSFTIDRVAGIISGTTITVIFPAGTDVTSLSPTIDHNGSAVNPNTGVAQDFTNPVTYTVTAANLGTQDYIVTAIVEDSSPDYSVSIFSPDPGASGYSYGEMVPFTIEITPNTDAINSGISFEITFDMNGGSSFIYNSTTYPEYDLFSISSGTNIGSLDYGWSECNDVPITFTIVDNLGLGPKSQTLTVSFNDSECP
ncbi:hypothetical protein [Cellulophaga sp. L1A9]|uniref:beta strand repeat-containing protein n=1 Tax=Cellulophaga sp. L1A9 TaxID=2686362 RepID=UPI0018EED5F5|nr:hypothetical protein [Cellulophaga sp. L1A9]